MSLRGIGLIYLKVVLLEGPYECGFESPGSISHEVSFIQYFKVVYKAQRWLGPRWGLEFSISTWDRLQSSIVSNLKKLPIYIGNPAAKPKNGWETRSPYYISALNWLGDRSFLPEDKWTSSQMSVGRP